MEKTINKHVSISKLYVSFFSQAISVAQFFLFFSRLLYVIRIKFNVYIMPTERVDGIWYEFEHKYYTDPTNAHHHQIEIHIQHQVIRCFRTIPPITIVYFSHNLFPTFSLFLSFDDFHSTEQSTHANKKTNKHTDKKQLKMPKCVE